MRRFFPMICALWMLLGAVPAASDESRPVWIGVWLRDAVDGGVELIGVVPDGPADQAGLRRGDVLVRVAGIEVHDQGELSDALERHAPGQVVALTALRSGKPLETKIELGRRAVAAAVPRLHRALRRPRLGLDVVVATPELRAHFGGSEETGVLVTRVESGQLAARAGIRVGDLIVKIDETPILDPRQLRQVVLRWDGRQPLQAQLVRGRQPIEVRMVHEEVETEAQRAYTEARRQARIEAIEAEIRRLEQRLGRLRDELSRLE